MDVSTISVSVLSDSGSGRVFFGLAESSRVETLLATCKIIATHARVVGVALSEVRDTTWQELADLVQFEIAARNIRQVGLIAFGGACAIAMATALKEPRLVRTIALVDGNTRAHPSRWERIVSRCEEFLPLGLPLRRSGGSFDVKPLLQRIRCPVLIVTSPKASQYDRQEALVLQHRMSTAWHIDVTSDEQLCEAIELFQSIPVKCPQKNLNPKLQSDLAQDS